MKKILLALVIGLAIFSVAVYRFEAGSSPAHIVTAADVEIPVNVTQKELKGETEALSSNLRIPVVSRLDDKAVEVMINTLLERDALKFKASVEKGANEALENSKEGTGDFPHKYNVETSYKVRYSRKGLLSLTVMYYQYTGGAHGMEIQKGYTFDLKTGKVLRLSDLFARGFDYQKVISEEILKYMKAHTGEFFPDAIESFKNINADHPFYIEEGNLVIYYGEYEIAPYAAGIPEFRIPFSKLKFTETTRLK